ARAAGARDRGPGAEEARGAPKEAALVHPGADGGRREEASQGAPRGAAGTRPPEPGRVMGTSLQIDLDSVTVHVFVPRDDDALDEYFNPEGPERPVRFFLANHCDRVGSEDMNWVPIPGDSIVVNEEEMIVRARVLDEPAEESGRRPVLLLASPPLGG